MAPEARTARDAQEIPPGQRHNFFPAQCPGPEQPAQRGCGASLTGDIPDPPGHNPATPRTAGRWGRLRPCTPQPLPSFCVPPAVLWRRAAPLGPLPNEAVAAGEPQALQRYRSFARYLRQARRAARQPRWWNTYHGHTNPPPEPQTDIGLPRERLSRAKELKERKRILRENHQNAEMERAARLQTALIPLEEVRAEWERTSGPFHKQRVARHCGVFRDLFKGATFTPWVALSVQYSQEDEYLVPVYYGNMVTPSEASSPPAVSYEADKGSLWTLLLTNPDGHLRDADSEYLHWLVTNIPGSDIKAGKEMCHYLPPFPAMGTGYHRFIFLLFKQRGPIDFSQDARPTPCYSLKMRTFSTFDFYKKHKDAMTPAGLAFFQCQWDSSVTSTFHQLLNMREPVFEFVRPPPYHPPQVKFPRHQPLRYLDRYRDTQEPTYGIY